jgi:prepilin-type N-terminal cleavage/methylation domain-containing protein
MNAAARPGVTLLELLIVLVLVGVLLLIPTLAPAPRAPEVSLDVPGVLVRRAIASGRETTAVVLVRSRPMLVSATPDGGLLIDSMVGLPLDREMR